jgi:hypothetical protein
MSVDRVVLEWEMSDLFPTRMMTMSGEAKARQSANQVCSARNVSRLSLDKNGARDRGRILCDIINKERSRCTTIITPSDRSKPFLSRCIPQLSHQPLLYYEGMNVTCNFILFRLVPLPILTILLANSTPMV